MKNSCLKSFYHEWSQFDNLFILQILGSENENKEDKQKDRILKQSEVEILEQLNLHNVNHSCQKIVLFFHIFVK